MKIVDVPEEGRRCFILREESPERKEEKRKEVEIEEKRLIANPTLPVWKINKATDKEFIMQ